MCLVFLFGLMMGFVFLVPMMQQGVSLVVVIFCVSSLVSIYLGFVGLSWYGLSLFLIYVGSLLVMFGYVVAMIPNFLFRSKNLIFMFVVGSFVGWSFLEKVVMVEGPFDVGQFMYSDEGVFVFLGLALVLLFTLICVVKVCYFSKSSLRPFF